MKAFVVIVILMLATPSHAGIKLSFDNDNAMHSGEVPEFPDKYDAIFYGLINNEDKHIKLKLMNRFVKLEKQMQGLTFPKLEGEDVYQYKERLADMRKLFLQASLVRQAWTAATDEDYAMLSQEDRVAKYEKIHGVKLNHVGAACYMSSEPVRR